MKSLPLKITHSIQFLNGFISNYKEIYKLSIEAMHDIEELDINTENYGNKLRVITKKFKERVEKINKHSSYEYNYQLFNEEMTDIISERKSEVVIYELGKYSSFYYEFKDLEKDGKKFILKCEGKKNKTVNDKDFIRAVSYNKVMTIYASVYNMITHIKGRLATLTNKED